MPKQNDNKSETLLSQIMDSSPQLTELITCLLKHIDKDEEQRVKIGSLNTSEGEGIDVFLMLTKNIEPL